MNLAREKALSSQISQNFEQIWQTHFSPISNHLKSYGEKTFTLKSHFIHSQVSSILVCAYRRQILCKTSLFRLKRCFSEEVLTVGKLFATLDGTYGKINTPKSTSVQPSGQWVIVSRCKHKKHEKLIFIEKSKKSKTLLNRFFQPKNGVNNTKDNFSYDIKNYSPLDYSTN